MLIIRVQPQEGIALRFSAKVPGERYRPRIVSMDFRYGTTFASGAPEAYERLLLDAMRGDQTLFTRADEVEAAWKIVGGVPQGDGERGVSLAAPVHGGDLGAGGRGRAARARRPRMEAPVSEASGEPISAGASQHSGELTLRFDQAIDLGRIDAALQPARSRRCRRRRASPPSTW